MNQPKHVDDFSKSLLLQTYKAFRQFCQDNGINYVAAGGTMIGAVRHGGMIPWDDDIDVYMLRPDYYRFIALREKLKGTDYEILDPTTPDYFCAMAKFSHRNSTVWEFRDIPCLLGIYIDIFVLDYEDGPIDDVKRRRMKFAWNTDRFCRSAICRSWGDIMGQLKQGNVAKFLWYLYQKCIFRQLRPFYRQRVLQKSDKASGEWVVAYTGTSYEKDVFRAEWFKGAKTVPFEDTEIEIPSGYDAFLTTFFGDYMTPPPVEQQVTHHNRYYVNLERRITEEEMEEIREHELPA